MSIESVTANTNNHKAPSSDATKGTLRSSSLQQLDLSFPTVISDVIFAFAKELPSPIFEDCEKLPSPTARKGQHSNVPLTLDKQNLVFHEFEAVVILPFNEIPYNDVEMLVQHLDRFDCDDVKILLDDLREIGTSIWSFLALYELSEKHSHALSEVIRKCYDNMEAKSGKSSKLLQAEFRAYLNKYKNDCAPHYAALLKFLPKVEVPPEIFKKYARNNTNFGIEFKLE